MDETIIQKLAKAEDAMKALQTQHAGLVKESGEKFAALDKTVLALTAERDQLKVTADKAVADLAASVESGKALTAELIAAKAQLADPSFRAAQAQGTQPVPEGKVAEPVTLASLEAAYEKETDPAKLDALRTQIFQKQNEPKK